MNAVRSCALLGTLLLTTVARADGPPAAPADTAAADAGPCDPDAGTCPEPTVKSIFGAKCASCHGADAKGKTKYGIKHKIPDFTTKHWQKTIDNKEIGEKIRGGVFEKGKKLMPPFKDKLTPDQVVALTVYLRGVGP